MHGNSGSSSTVARAGSGASAGDASTYSSTHTPKLGPKTEAFFKSFPTVPTDAKSSTVPPDLAAERAGALAFFTAHATPADLTDIKRTSIEIPGSPGIASSSAYVYKPIDITTPAPLVVYYVGTGFTLDLGETTYDAPCAKLAKGSGAIVIRITPPLAPETTQPTVIEHAYQQARYIYNHTDEFEGDRARFIIAGNSSGGYIAALVTQKAKDSSATDGINVSGQLLFSPFTNLSFKFPKDYHKFESHEAMDLMLPSSTRQSCASLFVPEGAERTNPDISPCFADPKGTPPTMLVVGECDGSKRDALFMHDQLGAAKVAVTTVVVPGQTHSNMLCRTLIGDGPDPAALGAELVRKMVNPAFASQLTTDDAEVLARATVAEGTSFASLSL
jgi:acetyl esterase